MLCRYWDASGERVIRGGVGGDTLAEFIVAELADTYDPDEDGGGQIANAVNALKTAHSDLRRVMDALENIGG